MDNLAERFANAKASSRKEVYDIAVGIANPYRKHDSVYLRVMEKVLNGTDEYFETEAKRCV